MSSAVVVSEPKTPGVLRSMENSNPSSSAAMGDMARLVRVVAWIIAFGLVGVNAWFSRYEVGPDGISYLDIARSVADVLPRL